MAGGLVNQQALEDEAVRYVEQFYPPSADTPENFIGMEAVRGLMRMSYVAGCKREAR